MSLLPLSALAVGAVEVLNTAELALSNCSYFVDGICCNLGVLVVEKVNVSGRQDPA